MTDSATVRTAGLGLPAGEVLEDWHYREPLPAGYNTDAGASSQLQLGLVRKAAALEKELVALKTRVAALEAAAAASSG